MQEEGLVEDTNWALDAEGGPGEEATLHLLMRVVADVGIVGLPNAGKSSLLAALTRCSIHCFLQSFILRPHVCLGCSSAALRHLLSSSLNLAGKPFLIH